MEMNRKSVGDLLAAARRQPKIKRSEYQSSGRFPIVDQSQADIAGYTDDESLLYQGELPVVIFGDHTRVLKFVDFPFCVGADGTQLIRPVEGNDIRYCYYALRNVDLPNYGYERHFKYLKEEEIPLPPLPTQRRIAGILSAYDELIENNQRRIRILEDMARSLYREWFVHFRYPGHDSPRPQAGEGLGVRAGFVDSPLGQIPQGWEVKKLSDVLELNYGKALKKEDRRNGEYPVFGSSGVVGTHDTALVKGPGIIVGRKGNVGSVFWCDDNFYVIDTAYFVTSTLPLRFLFYVLPTLNFINSDAAVPGLSRNQAYTLELLVPPADLLAKFCELANTFEQDVAILQHQISNLRRTRDLLLPRLLSGQVQLDEVGMS